MRMRSIRSVVPPLRLRIPPMVWHFSASLFQVEEPLSWSQRLSVLVDTCRGLAYLHSEVPPVVPMGTGPLSMETASSAY